MFLSNNFVMLSWTYTGLLTTLKVYLFFFLFTKPHKVLI